MTSIERNSSSTSIRKNIQGSFLSTEYTPPSFPKSQSETDFIDASIINHFIFESLNEEERSGLIDAMLPETVTSGTTLIKQGDVHANFFYLIASGKVEKLNEIDSTIITRDILSKGDTFGGLALIYHCPRLYTINTLKECQLYKLDRTCFKSFLATNEANKLKAVHGTLRKVEFFKNLDDMALTKIFNAMEKLCVMKGHKIITKGEVGDTFYIVEKGTVKMHDIGHGDSRYVDEELKEGSYFGARALLTGEPRWMNATATSNCSLYQIERNDFEATLGNMNDVMDHAMKKRYLENIPVFSNSKLDPHEMDHLVDELVTVVFSAGRELGHKKNLYIITKGTVVITQLTKGKIHILNSGDHFGGYNLRDIEVPNQTIIVEKDCTCYCISKEQIEKVIGSLQRLGKPMPLLSKKFDVSIKLSHVKKIKLLGMGGFGRVWLSTIKLKDPNASYALKMMNKRQIIKANQVQGIIREKNIMASIDHIFVANIIATFEDNQTLYVLQPFIQGGELFTLIRAEDYTKHGLPVDSARFYSACILEALAYLHSRLIIHRDIKPENVMIDSDGYGILIDLGFAKIVTAETYTLCGTPEYLAPEILQNKGHGKGVDYWGIGVMIYEMMTGVTPFNTDSSPPQKIFQRINKLYYSFPNNGLLAQDEDARNLIWKFLNPNKSKRLGCLYKGAQEIREHPWFVNKMDFEKLKIKELDAPWKPDLKDPFDVSAFSDYDKFDAENEFRKEILSQEEQHYFEDFSYNTDENVKDLDLVPPSRGFDLSKLINSCCFP